MKKILQSLHSFLSHRCLHWSPGIDSIWSPKWLLVALLYIMASGCMSLDNWYGQNFFTWNQGIIVILLSVVIVSTAAFEWHLLGKSTGINLFLQVLLLLPATMFLGRIIGKPWNYVSESGLLGNAIDKAKIFLKTSFISSIIPTSVLDIFSSPGLVILFICVSAALSFGKKKATKCGLLFTALLIPLAGTFAYEPLPSWQFLLGTAFMVIGISLQQLDVSKYIRDLSILARLKEVKDEAERKCTLRILHKAYADDKITETSILAVVRRCYTEQYNVSEQSLPYVAKELCRRLVYEHGLLKVRLSSEGMFLEPESNITFHNSILTEIALWPRSFVMAGLAIVWCIAPVDLIPDAIPLVGIIDDMFIMWLGAMPLLNQIKRKEE